MRAAYLFNLSKYVSWPRSMKDLKICSEADERTGKLLKQILEGKNSEGRRSSHIARSLRRGTAAMRDSLSGQGFAGTCHSNPAGTG